MYGITKGEHFLSSRVIKKPRNVLKWLKNIVLRVRNKKYGNKGNI
jgi:hypothetical protein